MLLSSTTKADLRKQGFGKKLLQFWKGSEVLGLTVSGLFRIWSFLCWCSISKIKKKLLRALEKSAVVYFIFGSLKLNMAHWGMLLWSMTSESPVPNWCDYCDREKSITASKWPSNNLLTIIQNRSCVPEKHGWNQEMNSFLLLGSKQRPTTRDFMCWLSM